MENKNSKAEVTLAKIVSKDFKAKSVIPLAISLILLFILVSYMGLRMALAKRKAAETMRRLKEVDDARLKAMEEAKMAESEAAREAATKRLEVLNDSLSKLAERVSATRESHKKYADSLQAITSWEDVLVVDKRKR